MNSRVNNSNCIRCKTINIDSKPYVHKYFIKSTQESAGPFKYKFTQYWKQFNLPICKNCRIKMERIQNLHDFGGKLGIIGFLMMAVGIFLSVVAIGNPIKFSIIFNFVGIIGGFLFALYIYFKHQYNNNEYSPKKYLYYDAPISILFVKSIDDPEWKPFYSNKLIMKEHLEENLRKQPNDIKELEQIIENKIINYVKKNKGKAYTTIALKKGLENFIEDPNEREYANENLENILNKLRNSGRLHLDYHNGETHYFFPYYRF
ncbi:MAG: hypothetical protein V3V33_07040 [Candidatus Lokiarchaeia archaeon]